MQLVNGDCLEKLKDLNNDSIDSIITDPPYGIKFMGKKWDVDCPSVEVWEECLRVLKPGAHLLSFSGTRTIDFIMGRIRKAGFEIRDTITWLYGSGFPKSHNIGKSIDKKLGNKREEYLDNIAYEDSDCWGIPNKNSSGEDKNPTSYKIPVEKNGGNYGGKRIRSKGFSDWEGWGTALKPACEFIVMSRKPFKGAVAYNVLKYGTGAINIDECRVETQDNLARDQAKEQKGIMSMGLKNIGKINNSSFGRWPANLILDEEAGKLLDEQSGISKSDNPNRKPKKGGYQTKYVNGEFKRHVNSSIFTDMGGASRFFYVAKASKKERGQNNNHPTVKPIKLMEYLCTLVTPTNGTILDPFMGSGSTGIAAKKLGFNFIGIELNKEYYNIAKKRIESIIVDQELNFNG